MVLLRHSIVWFLIVFQSLACPWFFFSLMNVDEFSEFLRHSIFVTLQVSVVVPRYKILQLLRTTTVVEL